MKVLVTGGAGYIGTELTYKLAANPNVSEIVVYDNLSRGNYNLFIGHNKLLHDKVRLVQADILDTRRLKKQLSDVAVVYHLAAKVSTPFADQNPHMFEQVNHWGTAELVYAVEDSDVERLVFLSSASVYGMSSEEVDTSSPPDPKTFYGISKMRGEEHVGRLFDKKQTYIIRCGNVYGYSKSMRFDSVINRFMFEAHYHGRVSINGNGQQRRSFVHVDKTTNVLANLLGDRLRTGRYDLVEDTLTINYVADTLKDIYPELEMLYVNQHMTLRELRVKPDPQINALFDIEFRTLHQVLSAFKEEFSVQ